MMSERLVNDVVFRAKHFFDQIKQATFLLTSGLSLAVFEKNKGDDPFL